MAKNAIKSKDPNAVELLEAKAESLEASHEDMKTANKHWRKHGTMKGCAGWTDEQAANMDAYLATRIWPPFPPYALANSKRNIADVKGRIAEIKKNKAVAAAGGYEYETHGLCEVIEDETAMRIRLVFPDKPDEQRRTILKCNGFVWSPSAGAWQRQLNNNGRYAVRRVLEILKEAQSNG